MHATTWSLISYRNEQIHLLVLCFFFTKMSFYWYIRIVDGEDNGWYINFVNHFPITTIPVQKENQWKVLPGFRNLCFSFGNLASSFLLTTTLISIKSVDFQSYFRVTLFFFLPCLFKTWVIMALLNLRCIPSLHPARLFKVLLPLFIYTMLRPAFRKCRD